MWGSRLVYGRAVKTLKGQGFASLAVLHRRASVYICSPLICNRGHTSMSFTCIANKGDSFNICTGNIYW